MYPHCQNTVDILPTAKAGEFWDMEAYHPRWAYSLNPQWTMPRPFEGLSLRYETKPFGQNILSGIAVAVVVRLAERAFPFADFQILDERVFQTAVVAELGRREELPDLHDCSAVLGSNVLQDVDEGRETVVPDLLTMPCGSLPFHV